MHLIYGKPSGYNVTVSYWPKPAPKSGGICLYQRNLVKRKSSFKRKFPGCSHICFSTPKPSLLDLIQYGQDGCGAKKAPRLCAAHSPGGITIGSGSRKRLNHQSPHFRNQTKSRLKFLVCFHRFPQFLFRVTVWHANGWIHISRICLPPG